MDVPLIVWKLTGVLDSGRRLVSYDQNISEVWAEKDGPGGPRVQWGVCAEASGKEPLRLRGESEVAEHGPAGVDLLWNLLCLIFLLVWWAWAACCWPGRGWVCFFLICPCSCCVEVWVGFPNVLLVSLYVV